MIETGESLKKTRESAGISLEEASTDINIPVLVLEQLESGSFGAFENVYDLKKKLLDYSKYLGLDVSDVERKFNEYMFDHTSKMPMSDIEKAIKEQEKETKELEEDRIASPYTKVYPKEKTLPYVLTGVGIVILVVIAVMWAVSQITIQNDRTKSISYFTEEGENYELTK